MTNFTSVDEVSDALAEHGYIPDRRVATTAFLMMQLDRPGDHRGRGDSDIEPAGTLHCAF